MSAAASSSTPAAPAPSPVILLFARGVLSLFQSWPVMRSAVLQSWGGPESEAKRTWFASMVVEVEDGSPEEISRRVIACWSASLQGDEPAVVALEEEAARLSKKKAEVVRTAAGEDDGDSSSDDDGDDAAEGGMDVDPAPARQERVREEPEVDDDGFTMVKKGKGKK
jgi:pre-rRNA-processing protein TSR2